MSFTFPVRVVTAFIALATVQPDPAPLFGQNHPVLIAESGFSKAAGKSGLSAALAFALHPDGILLWPGAPVVQGAARVGSFLAAQHIADSLRFTLQALGAQLSRDSTLGVTWGVAAAAPRTGATAPRLGRYVAAWRRDGERWTLAALLLQGLTPSARTIIPQGTPIELPPMTAAGDAAAFIAADSDFAKLAADSGAAIAFERYADADAVMGGGLQVRGPSAIGQAVSDPAIWRWHPVAGGAARSGDLGWTVGESVVTPTGGDPGPGKYLTVWKRLPDGRVRFVTDGGNARPAK